MKNLKNYLMTAALFMAVVGTANAQDFLKFGVKGGITLSQIKGDGAGSNTNFWQEDASRSLGYTVGAFARIGDKVYFQPELLITQKGGKSTLLGVERDFRQTYLDVPLLVGAKIANVLRVNAGPVATFLLNADRPLLDNLGIANKNDGYREAIFGYQAGVGFDIGKIMLDLRYEGNINDVFKIDYDNSQTKQQFSGKANLFAVTVGYGF